MGSCHMDPQKTKRGRMECYPREQESLRQYGILLTSICRFSGSFLRACLEERLLSALGHSRVWGHYCQLLFF